MTDRYAEGFLDGWAAAAETLRTRARGPDLPVVVRREPRSYMEPAYWHAACQPCSDNEIDTWENSMPMDAAQSAADFDAVIAWAVHHAYHCPTILAARLETITGFHWCYDCRRLDPPCFTCLGTGSRLADPNDTEPCPSCGGDTIAHKEPLR